MAKIRVVWSNGTEQVFEGKLVRCAYASLYWVIGNITIPPGQVRYFEEIEE